MGTVASDAIRRLLQAQEDATQDDGSGDVVFALFLEHNEVEQSGMFNRLVDFVVKHFQPSPGLVHVELVVPCAPSSLQPVIFATYLGSHSGWQTDAKNNSSYYLSSTANKWRAVPVFGKQAARHVRAACEKSNGVEYSLLRYVTAAWGVRNLAALMPDGPRDAAHCATLAARCLKSGIGTIIKHKSAWYGPTSLYVELCKELQSRSVVPDTTNLGDDVTVHVDCLLRRRDDDVSSMSNDASMAAIRALTLKASAAESSGDGAMAVMTQKQLANALFRWAVLRRSV